MHRASPSQLQHARHQSISDPSPQIQAEWKCAVKSYEGIFGSKRSKESSEISPESGILDVPHSLYHPPTKDGTPFPYDKVPRSGYHSENESPDMKETATRARKQWLARD